MCCARYPESGGAAHPRSKRPAPSTRSSGRRQCCSGARPRRGSCLASVHTLTALYRRLTLHAQELCRWPGRGIEEPREKIGELGRRRLAQAVAIEAVQFERALLVERLRGVERDHTID